MPQANLEILYFMSACDRGVWLRLLAAVEFSTSGLQT